jgi:multidrug resistance efflux pump
VSDLPLKQFEEYVERCADDTIVLRAEIERLTRELAEARAELRQAEATLALPAGGIDTHATDVATIKTLTTKLAASEAELAAVRELMNVYNLGGWTDAIGPMKRALQCRVCRL